MLMLKLFLNYFKTDNCVFKSIVKTIPYLPIRPTRPARCAYMAGPFKLKIIKTKKRLITENIKLTIWNVRI